MLFLLLAAKIFTTWATRICCILENNVNAAVVVVVEEVVFAAAQDQKLRFRHLNCCYYRKIKLLGWVLSTSFESFVCWDATEIGFHGLITPLQCSETIFVNEHIS